MIIEVPSDVSCLRDVLVMDPEQFQKDAGGLALPHALSSLEDDGGLGFEVGVLDPVGHP